MKDLIILTFAGILLWWIHSAEAELAFTNNTAWYFIQVFSF
jgi:hypothetical protein